MILLKRQRSRSIDASIPRLVRGELLTVPVRPVRERPPAHPGVVRSVRPARAHERARAIHPRPSPTRRFAVVRQTGLRGGARGAVAAADAASVPNQPRTVHPVAPQARRTVVSPPSTFSTLIDRPLALLGEVQRVRRGVRVEGRLRKFTLVQQVVVARVVVSRVAPARAAVIEHHPRVRDAVAPVTRGVHEMGVVIVALIEARPAPVERVPAVRRPVAPAASPLPGVARRAKLVGIAASAPHLPESAHET